jgi:hypothetical protein
MVIHISRKDVPTRILMFVEEKLNKQLNNYKIDNSGKYTAHMPWHEADRTYTQMFKLSGEIPLIQAEPTEFEFSRSGWEGDGNITGKELEGTVEIPSGFIFVEIGIYPERCTIYTTDTKFLPNFDYQLTEQELKILHYARSLVSSARPRFEDKDYINLINQGFLTKKKSITLKGKNALNFNIEKLKGIKGLSNVFTH